eukprot:CAMPEP_0183295616 /NCGR_PEP_ID=MMETSP0160_2-20130417/3514_1 /TAXON_ID=2839 ORGANISM="Odontella Sinensis, Strain Grunow 1884" /NCGR_SAMPLE_ID=MMETSP0160_2 /ASSEMBLY_ACC=CAM_ASM_000250 /LENGTH=84 /DNA_ID=CAMNT_0025457129 /DNA_START=57 /DNA_END=307 /DNA_ORIENTATION=-
MKHYAVSALSLLHSQQPRLDQFSELRPILRMSHVRPHPTRQSALLHDPLHVRVHQNSGELLVREDGFHPFPLLAALAPLFLARR